MLLFVEAVESVTSSRYEDHCMRLVDDVVLIGDFYWLTSVACYHFVVSILSLEVLECFGKLEHKCQGVETIVKDVADLLDDCCRVNDGRRGLASPDEYDVLIFCLVRISIKRALFLKLGFVETCVNLLDFQLLC